MKRLDTARVQRCDWASPRIVLCKQDEAPPPETIAAYSTPEGFLRVKGRINGCGVYVYEDDEGNSWGELRLPEHVGADATLQSWQLKSTTDDHPDVWLDAANVSQYRMGSLGTHIVFDGSYTWADILIDSPSLIAKVATGKTQLSGGYTMTPKWESGVYQGVPYELLQTGIYGNHVAVVDLARGGPECCLVFDMAKNRRLRLPPTRDAAMKTKKTDATLTTAEGTIEIPESKMASIMAILAEAPPAPPKPDEAPPQPMAPMAAKPDEAPPEPKPNTDAAKAREDMLAAENAQLKAKLANVDSNVDARMASRQELIDDAREVLPSLSVKGKTDTAIQKEVILALTPKMNLDGKSPEYIKAAYDHAIETFHNSRDSSADLLGVTGRATGGEQTESLDAAYTKMLDRQRTAVETA